MRTAASGFLIMLALLGSGLGSATIFAQAAAAAASGQNTFRSAAAAVDALIAANRHPGAGRLLAILGQAGAKLVRSGDPVADARAREWFLAAYDNAHRIEPEGPDKAVLIVGKGQWPVPIPLVREHGRWRFDTKAGAEEILDRRIGRDELTVIEICRAYVEAQRDYAARRAQSGKAPEFAQYFLSAPGHRDGLYWPVGAGQEPSPLGPLIARAQAAGYAPGAAHVGPRPYFGYFFRILTRQGPNAPGGARNYVVNGRMTGGFALLAYPARYGNSGVMTFTVNQDGIVYQKNLGPATAAVAKTIRQYDPDATWEASER